MPFSTANSNKQYELELQKINDRLSKLEKDLDRNNIDTNNILTGLKIVQSDLKNLESEAKKSTRKKS